jgi:hypothetical protein
VLGGSLSFLVRTAGSGSFLGFVFKTLSSSQDKKMKISSLENRSRFQNFEENKIQLVFFNRASFINF